VLLSKTFNKTQRVDAFPRRKDPGKSCRERGRVRSRRSRKEESEMKARKKSQGKEKRL